MSRWKTAMRAVSLALKGDLSLQDPAGMIGLSGAPSSAGVTVNPESLLRLAASWSCIRLISETIGTLPLNVYQRTEKGRELRRDNYLYDLVHNSPNAYQTAVELTESMAVSLCCYGQAYVYPEVLGPRSGRIASLVAVPKPLVSARIVQGKPQYTMTLRGKSQTLDYGQIIPIKGFGGAGSLEGFPPAALQRDAIGMTMAAEAYGAEFFRRGGRPDALLMGTSWPDAKKAKELRELIELAKDKGILVMGGDYSYEKMSGPPNENQFNETRETQVAEVARIYRVPLTLLMQSGDATYANTEQQNIHFLTYTLRAYLVRIEQAFNKNLLSSEDRRQGYYFAFNVEGLLRGDSAARSNYYRTMRFVGGITINEIRAAENLPNIGPAGDDVMVPLNYAPPDLVRAIMEQDLEDEKNEA